MLKFLVLIREDSKGERYHVNSRHGSLEAAMSADKAIQPSNNSSFFPTRSYIPTVLVELKDGAKVPPKGTTVHWDWVKENRDEG